MRQIGLHDIRKEFLDFFKEKQHLIAPSFSLVPENDKSLLLIGAGMAPLKGYFTGEKTPPNKRMATCQKCIRTVDIDNVGYTDRHATFFEMLGNFSFGDYFKKEAIEWAWEFLTVNMEIPKENLWVTVFHEDDEAYDIWNKEIKIPEERLVRLGKEDNFWELEVGPSGPCTEIFVDRGTKYGCGNDDCKPGCSCDRFIEVWNLVFTQFDKDEKGVYHPLANPNIDTGMGLERLATVLEEADNIFEIREIQKILNKVEEVTGYKYGKNKRKDISIRVITDHSRAMTFLVSDGVLPGNEGRGYILRRLIRRAARHGKLLGVNQEFLSKIVDVVIDSWSVEYKELETKREEIKGIIIGEEAKFQETIDQGISILENYIKEILKSKESTLSGKKAFKLYDTYGFPLDLTREILEERSLNLNEEEFKNAMEEQRTRARDARGSKSGGGWSLTSINRELLEGIESNFKGYENTKIETKISRIIKNNEIVEELDYHEEGIVLLRETPFYGESGGQIGDVGIIENNEFQAKVLDTQITAQGLTIHLVKVLKGKMEDSMQVTAYINEETRNSLKRNHTATHLLHKALRDVLGKHINQAGSMVMPNRLRFDFTHFQALSREELLSVEKIVNQKILEALDVNSKETSLEAAIESGAIGLFGDKYGEKVRVINLGDYSLELCGGTHVNNTSNIGMFKIISESGIASGVRRIEAITGIEVYNFINSLEENINELGHILKTDKSNINERVENLLKELGDKEKEIESYKGKMVSNIAQDIISSAIDIQGISLITHKVENMDMNSLRALGDEIRNKLDSGVIVLASTLDNKVSFVSMVTKDLNKRGILAGTIVKSVAEITGGSGGGRPDMAQAGGKDIAKVEEALSSVLKFIENQLEK